MRSPKPVCTECGACCVSPVDQDSFCDIDEKDEKRLGAALVRRYVIYPTVFESLCMTLDRHPHPHGVIATEWRVQKSGPFKAYEFCTCVFLQGILMKKVKCRVYEKRPDVCRRIMKPGDKVCRELRRCFLDSIELLAKKGKR